MPEWQNRRTRARLPRVASTRSRLDSRRLAAAASDVGGALSLIFSEQGLHDPPQAPLVGNEPGAAGHGVRVPGAFPRISRSRIPPVRHTPAARLPGEDRVDVRAAD